MNPPRQARGTVFACSPRHGGDATARDAADFCVDGTWYVDRAPSRTDVISAMGLHRQRGHGFFTVAPDGTRSMQSKEFRASPLRVRERGLFERRRFRWNPSGTALFVEAESNEVCGTCGKCVSSSEHAGSGCRPSG